LIVVPQSLVQQWLDEFAKHAPDVVVIRYEGWKKLEANHDGSSKNKYGASMAKQSATVKVEEDIGFDVPSREFISNIVESEVDVVLTDFATLRTDFDVRHPPPKRPRRGGVEYVRSDQPRSPIVAMHWWRLVIDETQLADPSGATKPAETLRVIPRAHSLAVSGTPAKAITSDLYGSLHFIGVPLSMRQWQSLQRMYFLPAFIGLFEKLCIRTTKKQLKDTDGLQETPAKYVVPVQLTPIEMQVSPRQSRSR
jgi:E3 ubiquitin-protein ligase SHPRH